MGFGQYTKVDDVHKEAGYPVSRTDVKVGRMTKAEIMAGVKDDDYIIAKSSAHNEVTIRYASGGIVCRLRETDIVKIDEHGVVLVDTGGWNTITTRRHISNFLKRHGFQISLWGDKKRGGNVLTIPGGKENKRTKIVFKNRVMFNKVGGFVTDLTDHIIPASLLDRSQL